MSQQYAYNYAEIEADGLCTGVFSDSHGYDVLPDGLVKIPEYNEDYIDKYYNRADGKWYYDAAFTNEWIPA